MRGSVFKTFLAFCRKLQNFCISSVMHWGQILCIKLVTILDLDFNMKGQGYDNGANMGEEGRKK